MNMDSCIFCQIVNGQIAAAKLYEDDMVLSFLDINPINPGHALVIPKKHATSIFDITDNDLSRCSIVAAKVARAIRSATQCEGLNVLQNNLPAAGQLIEHFHIHLIPRFEGDGFCPNWPGKSYPKGKMEEIREKIVAHIK